MSQWKTSLLVPTMSMKICSEFPPKIRRLCWHRIFARYDAGTTDNLGIRGKIDYCTVYFQRRYLGRNPQDLTLLTIVLLSQFWLEIAFWQIHPDTPFSPFTTWCNSFFHSSRLRNLSPSPLNESWCLVWSNFWNTTRDSRQELIWRIWKTWSFRVFPISWQYFEYSR